MGHKGTIFAPCGGGEDGSPMHPSHTSRDGPHAAAEWIRARRFEIFGSPPVGASTLGPCIGPTAKRQVIN